MLDISEGPPQGFNHVVFKLFQLGQFSQQRTHPVHHVIGLPHNPPSETQSHHGQDGFHRIAVVSASQLPCGSVSGRAEELNLTRL